MAFEVVSRTIHTSDQKAISQAARLLSNMGASKGGHARAEKLSEKRRKEIAQKAAEARWSRPVDRKKHVPSKKT